LNNLAIASVGRGNVDGAIRHFRRALEINPADAATHSNLARALLQNGNSDDAVKHLRRALELNPKDGAVHGSLAMIWRARARSMELSSISGARWI
jgi:Flp pilus assembly protein TadD